MVNEKSAEETCNITPFVIFLKKTDYTYIHTGIEDIWKYIHKKL